MLDLDECLTITVQRIATGSLIYRRMLIDIWQTPTGFTGGNMRYDDAAVKPLPLVPGDAFAIITPPEQGILIVDDNLDFQVLTDEEYEAMVAMLPQSKNSVTQEMVQHEKYSMGISYMVEDKMVFKW